MASIVSIDLLKAVADQHQPPDPAHASAPLPAQSKGKTAKKFNAGGYVEQPTAEDFANKLGRQIVRTKTDAGTTFYLFDQCPWNSDHGPGDFAIGHHSRGGWSAKCLHDGCKTNGWPEFMLLIDPEYLQKKAAREDRNRQYEERQNGRVPRRDAHRNGSDHSHGPEQITNSIAEDGDALDSTSRVADLPEIVINGRLREPADVIEDAYGVIRQQDPDDPLTFQRGGIMQRIKIDEGGIATPEPLTAQSLPGHVMRHYFRCVGVDKDGFGKAVPPPKFLVDALLTRPEYDGLAPLREIVRVPVFMRNYQIAEKPGYYRDAALFYHPPIPIVLPDTTPTAENIEAAKATIDDMLYDFPFADKASKANSIALLIQPVVRQLIRGCTPLSCFDAPTAGTGKSLLAEITVSVTSFGEVEMTPPPTSEEEWRKVLNSVFLGGAPYLILDNARRLDSPALYAAVTSSVWSDRLLGGNLMVKSPIFQTFIATMNNLVGNREFARRSVWIRLDAQTEHPEERKEFRHPDIKSWVVANRAKILGAVLTIARAWVEAGRPKYTKTVITKGSFEQWVAVMGGILENAGIPGFLENQEAMNQRVDQESARMHAFIQAWHDAHETKAVPARELFSIAVEHIGDRVDGASDRAQKTKLGKFLTTIVDRIYSGYKIKSAGVGTTADTKHLKLFCLEAVMPLQEQGDIGDIGDIPAPCTYGCAHTCMHTRVCGRVHVAGAMSPMSPNSPIHEENEGDIPAYVSLTNQDIDPEADADYEEEII